MDAKAEAPRKQPLYFINGPVDFALVGGLSIAIYFLIHILYGTHDPRLDPGVRTATDPVVVAAQRLLWICNWPHFAATSYRLYHSRDNIKQYPLTALVIPWLVLAGVFASVLYPDTIAPMFILTFMLWSPYHFSGQTVGVSLIYARRAGFNVGKVERLALSTFVFGTYLFTAMFVHAKGNTLPSYWGIAVPALGLPVWLWVASETVMYFAGIVLLLCVVRWCIQNRRVLPLIVLLPSVAQYCWFVSARDWPTFNEFVPFFHSMQYLLIAWSMQLKEKLDLAQNQPQPVRTPFAWAVWAGSLAVCAWFAYDLLPMPESFSAPMRGLATALVFGLYAWASVSLNRQKIRPSKQYVIFETLRWFEMNILFGAILFFIFPMALTKFFGVKPFLALGVTAAAVQIHHFFVDGVIWKLKRKTVSSPLMVNIDDLIHPTSDFGSGGMPVPALSGAGAGVGVGSMPVLERKA